MAATDRSRRTEPVADDAAGAGMDHPTVVPANFDPDEHGRTTDEGD